MYLEPMSFEEFLLAHGYEQLNNYVKLFKLGDEIPLALHDKLTNFFKEYLIVGGMPKSVSVWGTKNIL